MFNKNIELVHELCDRNASSFNWLYCIQAYVQLEAAINLGRSLNKKQNQAPGDSVEQPLGIHNSQVQHAFRQIAAAASLDIPNGHIATAQLKELLEALGISLDDAQLAQSIAQLDPDLRGSVPMDEFISWMNG